MANLISNQSSKPINQSASSERASNRPRSWQADRRPPNTATQTSGRTNRAETRSADLGSRPAHLRISVVCARAPAWASTLIGVYLQEIGTGFLPFRNYVPPSLCCVGSVPRFLWPFLHPKTLLLEPLIINCPEGRSYRGVAWLFATMPIYRKANCGGEMR